MLWSMNDPNVFDVLAIDGEVGNVEEFYFDDEQWVVRYIVLNTGNWLSGRQVLISPYSVIRVDAENRKLHLGLTKERIEKSPGIDTLAPITRQMEKAHNAYYGNPNYWGGPFLWGAGEYPDLTTQRLALTTAPAAKVDKNFVSLEESHLRGTGDVSTFRIAATDGEIGHVTDFIIEDSSWVIRYLVINTRNWLPGKIVLVSTQQISTIDWVRGKVHIALSREEVKQSVRFDASMLISREYDSQLHQQSDRSGYWLN